jgi:hypothetical protein
MFFRTVQLSKSGRHKSIDSFETALSEITILLNQYVLQLDLNFLPHVTYSKSLFRLKKTLICDIARNSMIPYKT